MEINQSNLQHLPTPPLSASEHNTAIYKKIRIIGRIGFILNLLALVIVLFSILLLIIEVTLVLAHPEKYRVGIHHTPVLLVTLLFATIYLFVWCLIFRRFTPEKLVTERTANLIILTIVVGILSCPLKQSSGTYWLDYFSEIVWGVYGALPMLALAYVMKLGISLKEENQLTV